MGDIQEIDFNNTYILERVNNYHYGSYAKTFETVCKIEDITDLIGYIIYLYDKKGDYFIQSNEDLHPLNNSLSLRVLTELQKKIEDYYNTKN